MYLFGGEWFKVERWVRIDARLLEDPIISKEEHDDGASDAMLP